MKKFLSIILTTSLMLLLVGNITMAKAKSGEITLVGKMGMDLMGEFIFEENSFDMKNSFLIAGEGLYSLSSELAIGAGIEYLSERKNTDYNETFKTGVKYTTVPIYGLLRYTVPMQNDLDLFLNGKVGYNFANPSINILGGSLEENTKGLCFGGGVGIIYDKIFLVEVSYSVYNSTDDDNKVDLSYSKLTIAGGINFSL